MGEVAISFSASSTDSSTMTTKQQSAGRAELSDAELVKAGYRYALSIARHHQDAEDLVQQAAHLQVKNRKTGALCTLYVASMNGSLSSLKSIDQHVGLEAHEIDIWEDSDRLFALVD